MIAELRRFRLGGTASDVLLVALLLAIAEAESVSNAYDVPRALVMLGSGLAVLPLLARRRAPIVAGTLSLGIALATVALVIDEDGGQLSMVLTVLAASYSVGAHAERGSVAWVAAAVFTMLVGMAIAEPSDLIFPALFFAFLPWLGGRLLRTHRALTRELARETVRAEEARADEPRPRDRTRAGAHRTRAARRAGAQPLRDGRAGGRRPARRSSATPTPPRQAARPSRAPAARRSPSCASCSAPCTADDADAARRPARASAASTSSCERARAPGSTRRCPIEGEPGDVPAGRGARRPTASCRRR